MRPDERQATKWILPSRPPIPKASPSLQGWEQSTYGLELRMKLLAYKEEIRSRQTSFKQIKRLNVHMPFMIGFQFSCFDTHNTQLQILVDKPMQYQKVNYYNGKELLIEDDEDASPTRYVKAHPRRLFKHDHEALKQKTELTNLNWYAIKRFHKLKAHCSGLELDKKPLVEVHQEIECCYQTSTFFRMSNKYKF